MARPAMEKLTYFPHDVGLMTDEKFRPLKEDFGLLAPAVYLTLLEMIYGDKGYYLPLKEKDGLKWLTLSVSDRLQDRRVKLAEITRVIRALVEADLFDAVLLERRNVLSSRRIQRTYLKSTEKRTAVKLDPELILLTAEETQELIGSRKVTLVGKKAAKDGGTAPVPGEETPVCGEETSVCGEETPVFGELMPQRKAEESIEEERESADQSIYWPRNVEPALKLVTDEGFRYWAAKLEEHFHQPLTKKDLEILGAWGAYLDEEDFIHAVNETINRKTGSVRYAFSIMSRIQNERISKRHEELLERPLIVTTNF